jgi:hypothetical protein
VRCYPILILTLHFSGNRLCSTLSYCLFAIHLFFFWKMDLVRPFPHFQTGFFLLLSCRVPPIMWILTAHCIGQCQEDSPCFLVVALWFQDLCLLLNSILNMMYLSISFFCMWIPSFANTISWRNDPLLFMCLLSKIKWLKNCVDLLWGSLCFVALVYISLFAPAPYCFDYY